MQRVAVGKVHCALILVLLVGAPQRVGAAAWSVLAPLSEARQEVAVASLGGRIYVIGGFRANLSVADTVEVYDPDTDRWSFVAPFPTPVHHAAAVSVGDALYLIGGWSDFFVTPLDTVYRYDPGPDLWTPQASMPTARGGLAVAVVGGKIYAAGGSPAARETDFAVYDPEVDHWTVLPSMPTARNHLAAGAIAGRFYAVGGRTGSGIGGVVSALEEFDPATGSWMARAPMPTARGGIGAAVVGGYLLVFGGEGNPTHPDGVFDAVEAYEPISGSWTALTAMPTPRHGIGAAAIAGYAHIPGGGPVEGFSTTDVHEVFDAAAELQFCNDGLDNDGDGLADFPADPGCANVNDRLERSLLLPCDDGADNDDDGGVDFDPDLGEGDPGCRDPSWGWEDPQCQDGINNDPAQDALIDFDGGVSAGVPPGQVTAPDPQCRVAWKNREAAGRCGLGFELVLLLPPLLSLARRRGRI